MINVKTTIKTEATLVLDEEQLRAMDALVGYGDDAFLKVFYTHLGEHYMRPHEKGLRSLFKMFEQNVPNALVKVDEAKEKLK